MITIVISKYHGKIYTDPSGNVKLITGGKAHERKLILLNSRADGYSPDGRREGSMKGPFLMKNSHHYSRTNFNIAVTGIFLGLALLFQYLSNFMGISAIMTINLSLAFIVPIFFVADYKFGLIAIISKFVIGIFLNPGMGLLGETIGQLILLFAGLIYIHLIILFKKLKLSSAKYPIILGLGTITVISSLVMALLNGVIFVPIYNWALGYGFSYSILGAWGLKTYWSVVLTIYIVGNLINYTIASMVLIPVFKIIRPKLKDNTKLAN